MKLILAGRSELSCRQLEAVIVEIGEGKLETHIDIQENASDTDLYVKLEPFDESFSEAVRHKILGRCSKDAKVAVSGMEDVGILMSGDRCGVMADEVDRLCSEAGLRPCYYYFENVVGKKLVVVVAASVTRRNRGFYDSLVELSMSPGQQFMVLEQARAAFASTMSIDTDKGRTLLESCQFDS